MYQGCVKYTVRGSILAHDNDLHLATHERVYIDNKSCMIIAHHSHVRFKKSQQIMVIQHAWNSLFSDRY